jgi:hypothetical protein
LCDRFHKLPSEIEAEDADLMLLLHIEELAGLREREEADDGE